MRILLAVIFLAITYSGLAQDPESIQQQIEDISIHERKGYQRRLAASQSNARTSASQNFNVNYYRCEWEVDPNVRYIKGKVTTHFVMTSEGNSLTLDLANEHTVSLVSRNNVPLTFVHSNNTLKVLFPAPIANGVKDSISISYAGVPPTAFGPFATGIHGPNQTPAIWTVSEPFGSKDWWPCKNGLDDKADSIDVYMTNPVNYKAVSNGLLQSETAVAGSKIVTHWKHRYPIASYLVCFAVTNFNVLNNSVVIGGITVPMQTHCYPESQASFAAGAQNAMDAMVQFSNLLGDYPFKKEKYGHVQFMFGGGMEHQTCSFMVNMGNNLIAHELAHQWFGDKITCGNWEDIWLNEGFATHFANIYMENKFPANVLAYRNAEISSATSEPGGSVWVDDVSNPNRIFSQRLSYYKGSHLLYMLRWILTDAVFFIAVKNYMNDPALAYGFATTANLKSHLEAASGKDLTYFFNQWFTGQGYPSYKVEWFPDGDNVQIKLSQTTSHASVGFFQLPVPLLFRNTITGQQKLVVLDNNVNAQVFLENLGFEPNQVTFDPERWLITKNNTITKVSDPLPVTFEAFSVACEGSQPQLSWSTSEEINADYFEVQKSNDAINWVTIGSVSASGNSKVIKNYTFADEAFVSTDQYYRIAEIDYDGTLQHSRILHAQCLSPKTATLSISPNPVQGELHFEMHSDANAAANLQILDIQGRSMQSEKISLSKENRLNVSDLKTGLYILRIENEQAKAVVTARFLKQ